MTSKGTYLFYFKGFVSSNFSCRKTPHYLSDFTDGFHPQIISSFLFLYFACLAPIIAFGALLGEATKNRIATIEGLVAGLISGVSFSLFSGQPLNLLGSTGPVYVFEKILFEMCEDQNWDYLSLREELFGFLLIYFSSILRLVNRRCQ